MAWDWLRRTATVGAWTALAVAAWHVDGASVGDTEVFDHKFRASPLYEYTSRAEFENERTAADGLDRFRARMNAYLMLVEYAVFDRAAVFVKAGAADFEMHFEEGETTEFGTDLAFGVGAKGAVWVNTEGDIWITAGLQYFTLEADDGETRGVREHGDEPGVAEIAYDEWQISADVSKQFDTVTAYAGLAYLATTVEQERRLPLGSQSEEFDLDDTLNFYAGVAFDLLPDIRFGVEMGFPAETIVTLRFSYTF